MKNGIDVLAREGFASLRGQRVGLVTNHSGLLRDGRATADALAGASGVALRALFGPEHGIRGVEDVARIEDGVDAATGLPVFSLYGARLAPDGGQLAELDTLVFDVQDVGCRFYTYISTLGHLLEAAAEFGKRVVVLDRPNPINGTAVEGPLADGDKLSFTAFHRLPVRHGMTVGELAGLFCRERGWECGLEIVRCEGWRRGDWWDATGLVWTNPSPNMRSLTQAALYPGVGLLEMTNVSVGRGTDTPFEVVGAPWVEPRDLAGALNAAGIPGARFVPVWFTPSASVHQGVRCGGVNVLVTDRNMLDAVRLGLTLALALRELYGGEWEPGKLLTLLANGEAFAGVLAGRAYEELSAGWAESAARFGETRRECLLYA